MTGEEIREQFRFLVDDETLSAARELVLENLAYDRLNIKRAWNYLSEIQETQTIVAGTKIYTAPTDILVPTELSSFDSSGETKYSPLKLINKRRRKEKNGISGYVYYDHKNGNFVFTKDPSDETFVGKILAIDYQYQPDQLIDSTSPVFNRAFHPILAYEMARHYFYFDQGVKDRSWNRELKTEYDDMYDEMVTWDNMNDSAVEESFNPANWCGEVGSGGLGNQ